MVLTDHFKGCIIDKVHPKDNFKGNFTDSDPINVKQVVSEFEKCGVDLVKYLHAGVKKKAAIRELIRKASKVAELCGIAVKDNSDSGRDHLVQVWGGSCENINRLLEVVGDVHLKLPADHRGGSWERCKRNIDIIIEVLKDMGIYKPMVFCEAPDNLRYPKKQFSPVEKFYLEPECDGGHPSEFCIDRPLPEGLTFDIMTGCITGRLSRQCIPETTRNVTAKNARGECTAQVTITVGPPRPSGLSYAKLTDKYTRNMPVRLEADTVNCIDCLYSIEPPLPKGMVLESNTAFISGAPKDLRDPVEYTVTATNKSGVCSTILRFAVTHPRPSGLSYAKLTNKYTRNVPVRLEADTVNCIGCVYSIEPPLPEGMVLDRNTALISGTPKDLRDPVEYTVTATNDGGVCSTTLGFAVTGPSDVDASLAKAIHDCNDLQELMKMEPKKDKSYGNWMVWMVHRAYLNDPSLVDFDFSNMPMPLDEWRVAPKLMEALATNTTIKTLKLPASNLRRTEGPALAEALEKNTMLKTVDVASNDLDQKSIKLCAMALQANEGTKLEEWIFSNNAGISILGVPTVEAIYELLKTNKTITKLGCHLGDAAPGYVDSIHKALVRNAWRGCEAAPIATRKPLEQVTLDDPPMDQVSFEGFLREHPHSRMVFEHIAKYVAEKRVVPTAQTFFNNMKQKTTTVKFSEVSSCLKMIRTLLLDISTQREVCCDSTTGVLKEWKEQNQKWILQVMVDTSCSKIFNFETANDQLEIRVGDGMAKWLR